MRLSATDRAFLRGQFPGLRKLTDQQLERWYFHRHVENNPAYDINESLDHD